MSPSGAANRSIGDTYRIAHTHEGTELPFVSITHTGIVHTKTVEITKTLKYQRFETLYWNRPHKKTAENSQNWKKHIFTTHLQKHDCDGKVKNQKRECKKDVKKEGRRQAHASPKGQRPCSARRKALRSAGSPPLRSTPQEKSKEDKVRAGPVSAYAEQEKVGAWSKRYPQRYPQSRHTIKMAEYQQTT